MSPLPQSVSIILTYKLIAITNTCHLTHIPFYYSIDSSYSGFNFFPISIDSCNSISLDYSALLEDP